VLIHFLISDIFKSFLILKGGRLCVMTIHRHGISALFESGHLRTRGWGDSGSRETAGDGGEGGKQSVHRRSRVVEANGWLGVEDRCSDGCDGGNFEGAFAWIVGEEIAEETGCGFGFFVQWTFWKGVSFLAADEASMETEGELAVDGVGGRSVGVRVTFDDGFSWRYKSHTAAGSGG
jgi:hypothetical protein